MHIYTYTWAIKLQTDQISGIKRAIHNFVSYYYTSVLLVQKLDFYSNVTFRKPKRKKERLQFLNCITLIVFPVHSSASLDSLLTSASFHLVPDCMNARKVNIAISIPTAIHA